MYYAAVDEGRKRVLLIAASTRTANERLTRNKTGLFSAPDFVRNS
jgi:hypothetical protein